MMKTNVYSLVTAAAVGAVGGALGAGTVWTMNSPQMSPPAIAAPVVHQIQGGEIIADLVERVGPAVVNIDTVSRQVVRSMDPFFGFFGDEGPRIQERKGSGSGFIVEANGLIVTNNHVIRGAKDIKVTLPDGRKFNGRVVGKDPASDLALVKIDGKNLPVLEMEDPGKIRVGQQVIAIGSPLGLQHSVTSGILSAVNRDIELNRRINFLQTDAPINPGNSGGPLLNLSGKVIGVNTAVAAQAQGIGFAVPVSTLKDVLPQLKSKGKAEHSWIGVGIRALPENKNKMFFPADHGVIVVQVTPQSPAEKAGIQPGDVVLEVDQKRIDKEQDLISSVSGKRPGTKITLLVSREGQKKTLTVQVEAMPEAVQQPESEE